MKYKKISNNENAIEIDGKVVLSFDPRYKEYLKWRDENPDLEKQLIEELEQEIENKRLYNNGAPHVELDENGDRQGKCLFYYENGNKKWEGDYKDDVVNGELIQYREDGKISSKEIFKGEEIMGPYKYYHGNGNLRQSGCIKNHRKEGEIISYWENGNLQTIEAFHNGLREGDLKRYTEDKKIIMSGKYTGNYKSGKWTWYYMNGRKMKQDLYKISVGFPVPTLKKRTNWLENGKKISEVERDGILNHGSYIVWYKNGNKKEHRSYDGHKLQGKWMSWHINGVKRAEGNMKYGMIQGKWIFWYHNGKRELECEFDFGNPIGTAKIYHDNGLLKQEVKL